MLTLIVCATTITDRKILLVRDADVEKSDYGDWLLPAGSAESGEGLEKAWRREIREETGLRIQIVRKLVEHIDPYTGEKKSHLTGLNVAQVYGGRFTLTSFHNARESKFPLHHQATPLPPFT